MPLGVSAEWWEGIVVYFLHPAYLQTAANVIGNRQLHSQPDNVPGHTSAVVCVVQGHSNLCHRLAWTDLRLKPRLISCGAWYRELYISKWPQDKYQLVGAIFQAWNSLSRGSIRSLVHCMFRKEAAAIKDMTYRLPKRFWSPL